MPKVQISPSPQRLPGAIRLPNQRVISGVMPGKQRHEYLAILGELVFRITDCLEGGKVNPGQITARRS
jgi:hypothetical protein